MSLGYKGLQSFLARGRVKIETEIVDLSIKKCFDWPFEFLYKQDILS